MPDTIPQPASPAKPRRRWLRFSLRTMLVVIALVGIWLGVIANRANRQRTAVASIRNAGGKVLYDYESDGKGLLAGSTPSPPGPDWLRNQIGIDYFATAAGVGIGTDDGDDRFAAIDALRGLEVANLNGKGVNDAMFGHLNASHQMRSLWVFDSSVTDAGWGSLERMSHLKVLVLRGSHINDATLSHVQRLAELVKLSLSNTQVTNAGLRNLKGLVQLKRLSLNENVAITDSGKQELVRAMPQLDIEEWNL